MPMPDEKNVVPSPSLLEVVDAIDELKRNSRLQEARLMKRIRNSRIVLGILLVVVVLGLGYAAWNGIFRTNNRTTQSIGIDAVRISNLENSFDAMRSMLFIVIGVGTLLGSFGALLSWRGDSRSQESHSVAMAGEDIAAKRSADLFDQSLKTIQLVNSTLELAKEATESAAKAHEESITSEMDSLLLEIGALLGRAVARHDYKQLVEDGKLVRELERLYDRQKSFEQAITVFKIKAPAEFDFVKGMIYHTKGDCEYAIKHLGQAARNAYGKGDRRLKQFADFWTAYEYDVTANHDEANFMFDQIADNELDPHLKNLLKTRAIESRFFESAKNGEREKARRARDDARVAVEDLSGTDENATVARIGLNLLIGNISMWLAYAHDTKAIPRLGSSWVNNSESETELRRALLAYEAGGSSWWSRVGVLEVKTLLSAKVDSDEYDVIAKEAMDRHSKRREPRSRLLLAATAIIAKARTEDADYGDERREYIEDLANVDADVHPYSPFRKCTVEVDELELEMKQFLGVNW